jgi:iron(II)-dependent oxidoreductase
MSDVFISYAAEDQALALALSDGLEAAGFTTWCYDRHSLPGLSYLRQAGQAIEDCRAFLLLLSPNSLRSQQIDREVVRAHEADKPFIPVLSGIDHAQFQARRPEWRLAIGSATSIQIRADGLGGILPRIVGGLRVILQDQPAPRSGIERPAAAAVAPAVPPSPPARVVTEPDGATMVLVSAGEFWMGSDDESDDEKPRHRVTLDAFYIDRYQVTNAIYQKFMSATRHPAPAQWNDSDFNGPQQPVVGVSWEDAVAYCAWAGKRLPTEAEWEKAARGTDGRKYPWGDSWDASRANSHESGHGKTVEVGSYPTGVSPCGAHNMAGNVWEWVADWYVEGYYGRSPERNPRGPDTGTYRVLRGGSWLDGPIDLRAANRHGYSPDFRVDLIGFRCARGLSP